MVQAVPSNDLDVQLVQFSKLLSVDEIQIRWCDFSRNAVRTIRHLFCMNIRIANPADSRGKWIFCCIQVIN
jgi:hypothetical protein